MVTLTAIWYDGEKNESIYVNVHSRRFIKNFYLKVGDEAKTHNPKKLLGHVVYIFEYSSYHLVYTHHSGKVCVLPIPKEIKNSVLEMRDVCFIPIEPVELMTLLELSH